MRAERLVHEGNLVAPDPVGRTETDRDDEDQPGSEEDAPRQHGLYRLDEVGEGLPGGVLIAQAQRRSHDGLTKPQWSTCSNCGETVLPHRACAHCGFYRGRAVLQVEES